jgi:LPS export ABC transporter protein LptC
VIGRILFLLVAIAILAVLLYMREPEGSNSANTAAQAQAPEPGFVALGAQIIETGDNGQPVYTLDAQRIEQPMPQGIVYLTAPVLHYEPSGGNPWVLTAERGQLPQSGHTADLSGNVSAEGKPQGSAELMHFNTSRLHVDMQQQLATTAAQVHVAWAGRLLTGRGMRADLKSGELQLFKDVSGVLTR